MATALSPASKMDRHLDTGDAFHSFRDYRGLSLAVRVAVERFSE
jgi:hypothetical protein